MSNLAQCKNIITGLEDSFNEKAVAVAYNTEKGFALQALQSNEFLLTTAINNPNSLQNAVLNIAAIGLSLNPANKFAYLVPRDKKVCLDISYIGLIKLATDTGSIVWAKAEIVCEKDNYVHNGPCEKPEHKYDPFATLKDRGKFIGVYCIAKTINGDFLVEAMSAEEIQKIRAASKGSDSSYSPWNNYTGQMWKKAVIKRSSNTWPKTQQIHRLDLAIQTLNEHEGIDFKTYSTEQYGYFKSLIDNQDASGLFVFTDSLEIEQHTGIVNDYCAAAPKNKIGYTKGIVSELNKKGRSIMQDMILVINESTDDTEIEEILAEISEDERAYLIAHLSPENQVKIAA